ncbi:hypothetical protein Aph01nite_60280 [Acrocarpospora phusangensis]|uniref:Secreted protein n=1 Tax=Acrocarpospora phusangensis TaxID=1070424 RepID=A0A919QHK1_9ACTN|nr:hypothetical protein [Acrocarpospora phusangensis]GIH27718.1 hypothetical protein Aph01nite_60280 [Acrocarpospora phusangensis]
MFRIARRVSVLVVAGAAASLFAAPAQASIGTCTVTPIGSVTVSAYCTGHAPSSFRAKIYCFTSDGYRTEWRYGPWRTAGAGSSSVVGCQNGWTRIGQGYDAIP